MRRIEDPVWANDADRCRLGPFLDKPLVDDFALLTLLSVFAPFPFLSIASSAIVEEDSDWMDARPMWAAPSWKLRCGLDSRW